MRASANLQDLELGKYKLASLVAALSHVHTLRTLHFGDPFGMWSAPGMSPLGELRGLTQVMHTDAQDKAPGHCKFNCPATCIYTWRTLTVRAHPAQLTQHSCRTSAARTPQHDARKTVSAGGVATAPHKSAGAKVLDEPP